ncbi:3-methyl-2-oxobutanoate hydroxymethyltransferase [Candidatus Parcubacteria bacterium]|nr:3-methyl-2-oxobutanoate hydroxymethyltransferase [Candidatus Parcubacteria bacterium]
MTAQGKKNTLSVTMENMLYHASLVRAGNSKSFLVGDMPFGSYQSSDQSAVSNACKFIQMGCEAVKCEASLNLIKRIRAIVRAEVLVMGHIGLNPHKIHEMGGHRIQGKNLESARELIKTAKVLEDEGIFALLLEGVTEEVATIIRENVSIPVYGIGSGKNLDGQLLISYDLLGLYKGFNKKPIYIPEYRLLSAQTVGDNVFHLFKQWISDVRNGIYPSHSQAHHMHKEYILELSLELKAQTAAT